MTSAVSHEKWVLSGADQTDRLDFLDGLRGWAIMAVLMVHTSPLIVGLNTPLRNFAFYGVRGVQLFFIVSGMTLTLTYQKRHLAIADFALKRFLRIAPMFYLAAVVYLVLGLTTSMRSPPHDATAVEILSTFLFLHGWLPSAINKVVPGGWSIAAEAMFYGVFPLIMARVYNARSLLPWLLASYVVAGLTNRVLVMAMHGALQPMAMPFWLCQLPAFVGGCLLATLYNAKQPAGWPMWLVLTCVMLALIIDSQLRNRSNLLVAIMLLTALVWMVARLKPWFATAAPIRYLGKISFSLYLIQFCVLDCLHILAHQVEQRIGPLMAFGVVYLLALGLAGGAATLTYQFVEQPFVLLGRRCAIKTHAI